MALDTTPREQFKDKSKWKSLEDQAKERRKKLKQIDDFFEEARAYAKAREAAGKSAAPDAGLQPAWEAMLPLVRGDIPPDPRPGNPADQVRAHLGEHEELQNDSGRWTGCLESSRTSGQEQNPGHLRGGVSATGAIPRLTIFTSRAPEILRKAGVTVIFGPGAGSSAAANIRNLPYAAAQAVAFGFPADEALKAVTLYPCASPGRRRSPGFTKPGKEATLFASDGDILDLRSNVKANVDRRPGSQPGKPSPRL